MRIKPLRPARRAMLLALSLGLLWVGGCLRPNSARGVVDRFIAAHYIAIDLPAAEKFCTGVALKKLQDEVRLTRGQVIDQSTRKPTIHYKLTAERTAAGHVTFVFRATIDVPEAGSFDKNWMITARKEGGVWKVANFSEYD